MQFLKRFKWLIIVLVLSVAFLALIGVTSKTSDIGAMQNVIASPINAVQKIVYQGTDKIKNFIYHIRNFSEVRTENEELKEKVSELENQLSEYKDMERRYKEFEEMFKFKSSKSDFEYIGCEIVGISGNSYLNGYIINKGTKDGIEERMVAITSEGLVGQVTSVGSDWAKVQTLANENIAVAGYVERTEQTNGLVKGYKDGDNRVLARIELPSLESDIVVGDVITTSGLGEVYPKGIKIGEVIEVYEDKSKVTKYGVIEPYVDIDKLSEVFIVKPLKTYNEDEEQ